MARKPVVRIGDVEAEYLQMLKTKRRAANTIRVHKTKLGQMRRYFGDRDLSRMEEPDIEAYISDRMDEGVAKATLNGDIYVMRMFFQWLFNRRRIGRNIAAELEYETIIHKPRWRLPVERFNELLDGAFNPIDRMLFALGLFTLLRKDEMRALRISDLVFDGDRPHLNATIFKSRKYDEFRMSPQLIEELERFLDWYKKSLSVTQLDPDWYLIPGKLKQGAHRAYETEDEYHARAVPDPKKSISEPEDKIKRVLVTMGCPAKMEGCHTLRRSGARAWHDVLRDRGVVDAKEMVRDALHHAKVEQTEHYIGLDTDRERRNVLLGEDMFPQMREQKQEEGATVIQFPFKSERAI